MALAFVAGFDTDALVCEGVVVVPEQDLYLSRAHPHISHARERLVNTARMLVNVILPSARTSKELQQSVKALSAHLSR